MQAQRSAGGITNAVTIEEWKVPDEMVGLIIGSGGEQITQLQAESGCKVQMAADSGSLPERICTLTGTLQSIEKAKELITTIINRGGPPLSAVDTNHVPDGHTIVEMMIPGPKVGLIIGKGGETIRNLQERAAVKMVLIQDGPQQTAQEKPLRITGDPDKCEYAKQLVMDLITEKELEFSDFKDMIQAQKDAYGKEQKTKHEITCLSRPRTVTTAPVCTAHIDPRQSAYVASTLGSPTTVFSSEEELLPESGAYQYHRAALGTQLQHEVTPVLNHTQIRTGTKRLALMSDLALVNKLLSGLILYSDGKMSTMPISPEQKKCKLDKPHITDVVNKRKKVIDHIMKKMQLLKYKYFHDQVENSFLKSGGNIMDHFLFCCPEKEAIEKAVRRNLEEKNKFQKIAKERRKAQSKAKKEEKNQDKVKERETMSKEDKLKCMTRVLMMSHNKELNKKKNFKELEEMLLEKRKNERLKLYQIHLLSIIHVKKYHGILTDEVNCKIQYCRVMQQVLIHQNKCELNNACTFPHCTSTRKLILHWTKCHQTCRVCRPIKRAFDKQHVFISF